MGDLDFGDPLLPPPEPVKAPDPFGLPVLTDEQKAKILEEKRQAEAERAVSTEEQRPYLDALTAVVDAFKAAGPEAAVNLRPDVLDAVLRAETVGLRVDRAALAAIGALDAPPEPDLDAAPPEPVEEPEPEVRAADPSVNPQGLPPEDGMVPVYNPTTAVAALAYNGRRYPIGPKRIGWASLEAANEAVGPDNCGGRLSKMGVRRLYGNEARFFTAAKESGVTLSAWVQKRNDSIVFMADGVWEKALKADPRLSPPETVPED